MNYRKLTRDLFICSVPLILYLLITVSVLLIKPVTDFDIELIKLVQGIFGFIPPAVFEFISELHHKIYLLIIIPTCIFLLVKRDFFLFIAYPVLCFSSRFITEIIKGIIARPRPPVEIQIASYHPETFSFHSNHSFQIMILCGLLMYICGKHIKNKKISGTIISICPIWILAVGFSRIILGVHYPTDVLAGIMLGLFVICIVDKIELLISNYIRSLKENEPEFDH